MSIIISSSAAELMADPRKLLEEMRAGRVITLADLGYTIAPTAIVELDDDEIDDEAGDMVSLTEEDTGIANTIFASTKGYVSERHGPRVKIAIDPARRFIAGGKAASMSIHDFAIKGEYVPAELADQVRRFIDLNREALLAYWNGEIGTREFMQRVRPIA
jgi:hypothetical protein